LLSGIDAQTSGTAVGSQKTIWFCAGSHVAWHWMAVYTSLFTSRRPQQNWPLHSAVSSQGMARPARLEQLAELLSTQWYVVVAPVPWAQQSSLPSVQYRFPPTAPTPQ
jgi:hypothetical protein